MELRDLPSVDRLAGSLAELGPPSLVTEVARHAIEEGRRRLLADPGTTVDVEADARSQLARLAAGRLRRLINATGVLLHTNLGRAPLPPEAADAARDVAVGYANVEFDVTTGERGGRGGFISHLLTTLTGAESGFAVNNNAGGLLLALAALAKGGSVVVSRGELIEIGGSFRLPSLMAASGATLVEVGTTNRTRISDYDAEVGHAAAILKVHPSNYRVEGFAEDVSYADLAGLAHRHGIPFIADVGSGLLDARTPWLEGPPPSWVGHEPAVRQTLEDGADVVLFSGDKLLGGPQAGIAVGTAEAVGAMKRHPIARAVRCDGSTLAALGATLEMYAAGHGADVPFWRMASASYEALEARSAALLSEAGVEGTIRPGESVPGAGSVPGETLPSPIIEIEGSVDRRWHGLLELGVIARRREGTLILDLRSVLPEEDDTVTKALSAACA